MISEKPSLYLIPSAYKTSVLYLQLPEGSAGNMVFARSSVATRTDKNELIAEELSNIPRLDYENDICPELLLEPTRTNLCLRSEEFDNAVWTKSSVTVTANASVSPDGTKTAERIVGTGTGDGHTLQVFSAVTSGDVIFSVYLKGRGVTRLRLQENGGDFTVYATLNITLTNDWTRYELFVDKPSDGNPIRCLISDIQIGDDFYMWGGQLEQNDYSTSYIKTTTVSVTRATETCNNGGDSDTFNSLEGVLYCEISALFDDATFRMISISDATASNGVQIRYSTTSQRIQFVYVVGGAEQASLVFLVSDVTDLHKVAVKWKVNDFALWIDGVERATEVSGSVLGADVLTQLKFDQGNNANPFFGRTKEIRVYKTALTDEELTELTTI